MAGGFMTYPMRAAFIIGCVGCVVMADGHERVTFFLMVNLVTVAILLENP